MQGNVCNPSPSVRMFRFSPPLASAAQRRGERGAGGVRGKKSANPSMFLCTHPKDLDLLNTLLYDLREMCDRGGVRRRPIIGQPQGANTRTLRLFS